MVQILIILILSFSTVTCFGVNITYTNSNYNNCKANNTHYKWPPFIDACYYGKIEIVKEAIKSGIDINEKFCSSPDREFSSDFSVISDSICDNWYPIMFAISGGSHEVIEILLNNNVKLDVVDRYGFTPLMLAVIHDDIWTVENLLNNGVDINQKSFNGKTAIMFSHTLKRNEIYNSLKKQNANIDFYTAIKHNDLEVAENKLEEDHSMINKLDNDGWNPLTLACIYSKIDLVELLLKEGALINQKNNYAATALMHAALRNRFDIVKLLLYHGADVNETDKYNQHVIIWAVRSGNLDIVKLIVENGADVNVCDIDGKTPLAWAKNYPKIQDYLMLKGAK